MSTAGPQEAYEQRSNPRSRVTPEYEDRVTRARLGLLLQRINRYWAGEAEVAAAFFSVPRERGEHVQWLASQMARELGFGTADGRTGHIRKAQPYLERLGELEEGLERHELCEILEEAYEEFSHYVLLADLAEELNGAPLTLDALEAHRELPEWKRLMDVRAEDRAAPEGMEFSALMEGGGLALYAVASRLQPLPEDPHRGQIAQVMARVLADEVSHAQGGFGAVEGGADALSDDLWEHVVARAERMAYQRVRMRNEQFGGILDEARLEEIRQGWIAPYVPDFLNGLRS